MGSSFSCSVGSTGVTGGVSVIIVFDTVVGELSIGSGAVLQPHPTIKRTYPFMQHLLSSIEKSREVIELQMGKSDIEPPDYAEKVAKWYEDLINIVREKAPEYYVKSVNIYENGLFDINHIEYIYFAENYKTGSASINLFDTNEQKE